jgi:hypothetical protein
MVLIGELEKITNYELEITEITHWAGIFRPGY